MSKYNLQALKDREVTAAITGWINGRVSDERVSEQLDKVFVVEQEDLEVVTENPLHQEYLDAVSGTKDKMIAFADKHGIDLSGCTNNKQRAEAITFWHDNL